MNSEKNARRQRLRTVTPSVHLLNPKRIMKCRFQQWRTSGMPLVVNTRDGPMSARPVDPSMPGWSPALGWRDVTVLVFFHIVIALINKFDRPGRSSSKAAICASIQASVAGEYLLRTVGPTIAPCIHYIRPPAWWQHFRRLCLYGLGEGSSGDWAMKECGKLTLVQQTYWTRQDC